MIYSICAMKSTGGPIFIVPLDQTIPFAAEMLGQSEGNRPKEAYVNWLCEQQETRLRAKKLFKKQEFDEQMIKFRAEIEESVVLWIDTDVTPKPGVFP